MCNISRYHLPHCEKKEYDLVSSEIKNLIKEKFTSNKLLLNQDLIEVLDEFAELLVIENKKYNLTRIVKEEEIVDKHFIDSILGFERFLEKNKFKKSYHMLDIGSGAGFPGIPLILYDQICKSKKLIKKIHLLDSNRKKCDFLNLISTKIRKRLPINLIKINHARLEHLLLEEEIPDIFVSRATGKISDVLNFFENFLKNNIKKVIKRGEVELLHYGGPDSTIFREKKSKVFSTKEKMNYVLHRKVKEVYEYKFSSENYARKNVLYVFRPIILSKD